MVTGVIVAVALAGIFAGQAVHGVKKAATAVVHVFHHPKAK